MRCLRCGEEYAVVVGGNWLACAKCEFEWETSQRGRLEYCKDSATNTWASVPGGCLGVFGEVS